MQEFECLQSQIEESIEDATLLADETQYRSNFESVFYSTHAKLSDIINEISNASRSDDSETEFSSAIKTLIENQTALNDVVKNLAETSRRPISITHSEQSSGLPKVILNEFSGKFDEWIRFRDLFTALVICKKSVTGIEKMEYLLSRLKGDALSLVSHLPRSNENFSIAWKLLGEHYEKPNFIMVAHLDNIFDQPVIKSGSLCELKRLFSTTIENMNALRTLKLPVDSWDTLLVYTLTRKLDSENKLLWIRAAEHGKSESFADFSNFLKERINELESLNLSKVQSSSGRNIIAPTKNKDSGKRVFNITIPSCPKCQQKHMLYQCVKFRELTGPARCEFVKANGICCNCLRVKHSLAECKFSNCKTCNLKHNTLLHVDRIAPPFVQPVPAANQPGSSNGIVSAVSVRAPPSRHECLTMLPTAIILIKDINGEPQSCRALLDSGSQATLISESCVQRLGLKRSHAKFPVIGLGQNGSTQGTRGQVSLIMSSTFDSNSCISANAFILASLINCFPSFEIPSACLSHFKNLSLADPYCYRPSKVDLLLGSDLFFDILADGKIVHPSGSPIAQNTIFGWVIAGSVPLKREATISVNHSTVDLDLLLKNVFEPGDLVDGIRSNDSEVSADIEKHFIATHKVNQDGRYVVSLPFNKTSVVFGDSRGAALNMLHSMERRFSKNPILKQQYIDFMREYERLGHMKIVPINDLSCPSFYLPHHAVLKPDSATTKLRVVFNASYKSSNGHSLNDYLHVGPTIQNDLFTCLIRFRKNKIAIKADIAKMYRQVLVDANDVHFQRIVWREEVTEEPRDYMLLTVTYGTASASFLATRVLKQIGLDNMHLLPTASKSIIEDFYVDDYMSTFENVDEAIQLKTEVVNVLNRSGMDLRKWSSNSIDFLNTISPEHRESDTNLIIGETGVKTLGLLWDTKYDCFKFAPTIPAIGPTATKREVLSVIARIFDPLGWLSPIIVKMKIFIKRLWIKRVGWDEFIPTDFMREWSDFNRDLYSIQNVNISRWIHFSQGQILELHGFADASESAYAAAVYARVVGVSAVETALICSKTRIAPVKPSLSIPRLELCGSLLLSQLLSKVKEAFAIHDVKCFAYTDSTTVLHWIKGYPRARNVFVDNRISKIVAQFPVSIWHHVRTAQNPVDCATRGIMPKCLLDLELWWKGPEFLRDNEIVFSEIPSLKDSFFDDEVTCLVSAAETDDWDHRVFEMFSNLNRLLRVIARCIRLFRNRVRPRDRIRNYFLSPNDLHLAKIASFKLAQKHIFKNDIALLENGQAVSKKNKHYFLRPFIDEQGVLRVGGRLENARIPFEQKHPVILHKNHPLTNLIVNECHLSNLHAGMRQMTYQLSLHYCVIGIHHVIKRVIYRCTTCIRPRAIPFQQQMASLPRQRLEPGGTFGNTGVDYAGPFFVRSWKGRGAKLHKVYISLFVCMATKALHLELVSDLSSSAFIAALRRFVSRRGRCHSIFSDNGTNFVGANQQLRDWANLLDSTKFQEDVTNELTTNGITWHFSPPHAPHFGGLWEAGVKTTKFHLRRVLGQSSLTYEELSTVLCQVEACANSRPLCARFEGDMDPLTPAHFLIARPLTTVPDPSILTAEDSLRDRWQYLQRLVLSFWEKWSKDYLIQLRKRPKWLEKSKNIQPNDVVILIDENQPPCRWLMGRIVKTYPGRDGLVRVASVITAKGEFKRPVCKLCPLLLG
ncbi:uncharacterized protein LOC129945147 [Eupeodes corollae]|uniref:uncharacterized protein LOC129945147 n=1 Tax=Eupeodes corollae TaxID=290404 RepID=UPI00248F87DF|nr:uncharacterized protein LOC129945147 [Eupeodes corollae]